MACLQRKGFINCGYIDKAGETPGVVYYWHINSTNYKGESRIAAVSIAFALDLPVTMTTTGNWRYGGDNKINYDGNGFRIVALGNGP